MEAVFRALRSRAPAPGRASSERGLWSALDAVELVVRETSGHSYFLQQLGQDTWNLADGDTPREPKVIAVYYVGLMLHDSHKTPGMRLATGGGGARKVTGLPRTPKVLIDRLRLIGADVKWDELDTDATVDVVYKGQNLGKTTVGRSDRKRVETDWQRTTRKIQAIDRRAS